MFVKSFRKTAVSMLAATLCAALLVSGCSDDDDNGGGGRDVPSNPPIGLVLPSGQAWTNAHEYSPGNRMGVIFTNDGQISVISDYIGYWVVEQEGTYTSTANRVIVNIGGTRDTITYGIIDNRLANNSGFGDFVITSNVRIGNSSSNSNVVEVVTYYCPTSCAEVTSTSMPSGCFTSQSACRDAVGGGGVTPGGSFTNGARDIWFGGCEEVTPTVEMCYGIAFRNGIVFDYMQMSGMGNTWYEMEIGTYTTSGNRIIFEEDFYLTYSVSGNTLRLDGIDYYIDTDTFTRRGNLTFITWDDDNDFCDLYPDMCDDDEPWDEVYRATITVSGGTLAFLCADEHGDCSDPSDPAWDRYSVLAWEGERVFIDPGVPNNDGYEFVGWQTNPASLANQIRNEGNGLYSFIMPSRDVTITAVWESGGNGGGTEPATYILFNWDLNEEVSEYGELDLVVADSDNVEFVYEIIDEIFDYYGCGYYTDEYDWQESECWYLLSEFPRYPGFSGDFPIVFEYGNHNSRRDHLLQIDNTANAFHVVGADWFTAFAVVYDLYYDDISFIVANYEIVPATRFGDTVDYAVIFDIGAWLEGDCGDAFNPNWQCVYFGEIDDMDDWLFKGKPRRPNMIRRIPGTQKVANGLEVSYWMIRTSNIERDRFRPLRRTESQAQPQPEQSQPRAKFMQRESDGSNERVNRRSPFRSPLRRAMSAR